MNMTRLTLALAASLTAAPVLADTPAVNFDQGIDASAILKQSKEAAKSDAGVVAAQYMGGHRTVPDCVSVSFGANDPAASPRFELRSQEYVEECYPPGDPRHGGGRQCYERPGMAYHKIASVTIRDRQALLPWEHDTFRVCLDGPWLSISEVETAYDYMLVSGDDSGAYVLAPGRKLAQRPDPAGVRGELDSSMTLTLRDQWASYYAGETIEIKYALKKDVPNWFDAVIAAGSVRSAVAESYTVDFSKSGKFENGKKYYVEYSIRRIGKVSTDSFTKTLETGRVTRASMSLAFNQ